VGRRAAEAGDAQGSQFSGQVFVVARNAPVRQRQRADGPHTGVYHLAQTAHQLRLTPTTALTAS